MFPFSLVRSLDGCDLAGFEPSDTTGVRAAVVGLAGWLVDVPDPRRAEGRRHALVAVLSLLVVAAIAGCKTLRGSVAWSKDLTVGTVLGLGFTRGVPARSTISALLKDLDPVVVCGAVTGWLAVRAQEVTDPDQRVHAALDGKALRGAKVVKVDGRVACQMQLAVFRPDPGVLLAAAPVEVEAGKGGEIAAAKAALDQLGSVAGWVFTADALHTTTATAGLISARGAHYVLAVKGNTAVLDAEVRDLPWPKIPVGARGTAASRPAP